MSLFKDKTLMITGGTGSFGNAVLNGFLETDIKEIRIFSRDEKKQDDMRHEFQAKMPEASNKIKFFIGDVRDLASVKNAMHGVDYIFHAAALKQVPSCEFFPIEAVKTNVLGTENVLTAAIEEGVKSVICLSTDKAAYPVNAMGTSKAMMEKVIVKELEGAKLQVTDESGKVVDSWTSGKEAHIIKELVVGQKYTLTETKPADGFVTAESITFTVKDNAETQKIEMKDDVTKVEISKTDISGKELPGAKLRYFW